MERWREQAATAAAELNGMDIALWEAAFFRGDLSPLQEQLVPLTANEWEEDPQGHESDRAKATAALLQTASRIVPPAPPLQFDQLLPQNRPWGPDDTSGIGPVPNMRPFLHFSHYNMMHQQWENSIESVLDDFAKMKTGEPSPDQVEFAQGRVRLLLPVLLAGPRPLWSLPTTSEGLDGPDEDYLTGWLDGVNYDAEPAYEREDWDAHLRIMCAGLSAFVRQLPDSFRGAIPYGWSLDNRPLTRALFSIATSCLNAGYLQQAQQVGMGLLWFGSFEYEWDQVVALLMDIEDMHRPDLAVVRS